MSGERVDAVRVGFDSGARIGALLASSDHEPVEYHRDEHEAEVSGRRKDVDPHDLFVVHSPQWWTNSVEAGQRSETWSLTERTS